MWDYENYMLNPDNKEMYSQSLNFFIQEWFLEKFGN